MQSYNHQELNPNNNQTHDTINSLNSADLTPFLTSLPTHQTPPTVLFNNNNDNITTIQQQNTVDNSNDIIKRINDNNVNHSSQQPPQILSQTPTPIKFAKVMNQTTAPPQPPPQAPPLPAPDQSITISVPPVQPLDPNTVPKVDEAPESPASRKRRLNTQKVRLYRKRKKERLMAQLIAEGKPIKVRKQRKTKAAPSKKTSAQQISTTSNPLKPTTTTIPVTVQPLNMPQTTSISSTAVIKREELSTADLCDVHIKSPSRLHVTSPGLFFDYGGVKAFHGQIETVKCFESNPIVRKTLEEPGNNRVLVVDGGGSKRVAILGDQLASMGQKNNWSGIIVNGCIRDSKIISTIPIGVKALGTHPVKSLKNYKGEKGCLVAFADVEFKPGNWVYADEDGIIISEKELTLNVKSKL